MKKRNVYLCLSILWMIVIFSFSMQNGGESSGVSNQVILFIEKITGIQLMQEQWISLNTIQFLIRKAAHMSEYALLAILLFMFAKESRFQNSFVFALLFSMFYACTDEFHQLFVSGRSGQWQDVLIDTSGAFLGLCAQKLWFIIKNKVQMRRCKNRKRKIKRVDKRV